MLKYAKNILAFAPLFKKLQNCSPRLGTAIIEAFSSHKPEARSAVQYYYTKNTHRIFKLYVFCFKIGTQALIYLLTTLPKFQKIF